MAECEVDWKRESAYEYVEHYVDALPRKNNALDPRRFNGYAAAGERKKCAVQQKRAHVIVDEPFRAAFGTSGVAYQIWSSRILRACSLRHVSFPRRQTDDDRSIGGNHRVTPRRQSLRGRDPRFGGFASACLSVAAARISARRARSFARRAVRLRLATAARAFSPLIRDIYDLQGAPR
jgi:hypothetical protein